MNLKSREYQNILLFSSPCANTEAENSMNKSWTKISRNLNGFLKKSFYEDFTPVIIYNLLSLAARAT